MRTLIFSLGFKALSHLSLLCWLGLCLLRRWSDWYVRDFHWLLHFRNELRFVLDHDFGFW
jgi:hypothetical protein